MAHPVVLATARTITPGGQYTCENFPKSSNGEEQIILHVVDHDTGESNTTNVEISDEFRVTFDSYASFCSKDVDDMRFYYDGVRVRDEDTPKSLGMKGHVEVYVVLEERGGGGETGSDGVAEAAQLEKKEEESSSVPDLGALSLSEPAAVTPTVGTTGPTMPTVDPPIATTASAITPTPATPTTALHIATTTSATTPTPATPTTATAPAATSEASEAFEAWVRDESVRIRGTPPSSANAAASAPAPAARDVNHYPVPVPGNSYSEPYPAWPLPSGYSTPERGHPSGGSMTANPLYNASLAYGPYLARAQPSFFSPMSGYTYDPNTAMDPSHVPAWFSSHPYTPSRQLGSGQHESRPLESVPEPFGVKLIVARTDELSCKVKSSTTIGRILRAYCERHDLDFASVRFLLDGERIQNHATVGSLGLDEGSEIQVVMEQTGGAGPENSEDTPDNNQNQDQPDTPMQDNENNGESPKDNAGETANPEPPKTPEPEPNPLQLNIKVVDQQQNIVFFKIKFTTPLRKIMDAYCARQGTPRDTIRFMFEGQRIQDADTPTTLELVEDDTIEVYAEQVGGGDGDGEPRPERLNLKVKNDEGETTDFRIKFTTIMGKVMKAYYEQKGVLADTMTFIAPDGKTIEAGQTPADLELKEGDVIMVKIAQVPNAAAAQAEGAEGVQAEPKPAGLNIEIKDDAGNTTSFRIKTTTVMGKVMKAYCDQRSLPETALRFFTPDGTRITAKVTAAELELEDGDSIDAHLEQVGGAIAGEAQAAAGGVQEAEHILRIKVKNDAGEFTDFIIRPSTIMAKVMGAFSEQYGLPKSAFKFVTPDGRTITAEHTAAEVPLESGNTIDAHLEQAVGNPIKSEVQGTTAEAVDPLGFIQSRFYIFIEDLWDGRRTLVLGIKGSTHMRKVKKVYCEELGLPSQTRKMLKLVTLDTGDRVRSRDTARELRLVHGDVLLARIMKVAETAEPEEVVISDFEMTT